MFLLDTHILLWWLSDDKRLSSKVRLLIRNRNNLIYVSAASVWEIAIKSALGKLKVSENFTSVINEQGFENLDVTVEHAWGVSGLPRIHNDPFDRLLVSQAMSEGLTLITHDLRLSDYGAPCLTV